MAALTTGCRVEPSSGASGAVGALAGLTSTGLSTQMAFAAEPYTGDVLVVLSLRGGFDGLNTIVPTGDPRYAEVRPIDRDPAERAAAAGLDVRDAPGDGSR